MINAKFFKSGDLYTGFCVEGHSGSAESGQDIICAFDSSACYMAANTITEVIKLSATAEQSDGYLSLSIKENPISAQDILCGLVLHLTELQKDYPKNIKVIISEV